MRSICTSISCHAKVSAGSMVIPNGKINNIPYAEQKQYTYSGKYSPHLVPVIASGFVLSFLVLLLHLIAYLFCHACFYFRFCDGWWTVYCNFCTPRGSPYANVRKLSFRKVDEHFKRSKNWARHISSNLMGPSACRLRGHVGE